MLNTFKNVLQRFKNECLASGYEMLLEADVSGWLFHLLVTQPEINPQQIHLDTRICNVDGRFDVAIGPLRIGVNERPCIQPQLVVEIKIFPRIGFTSQQHRVHYEHILNDDFPKLGKLNSAIELRMALIVDGQGYLQGIYQGHNRQEYLIKKRNDITPRAHVFILYLTENNWQIKHIPPKKEIRIFEKFASLAPYPIDRNSIKSEDPPKPDISCNLLDGTTIAFELVECIDESIAQSFYDSLKLRKAFCDELENLPKEKKEKLKANFRNASIYIAFIRGISFNKKKSSIPIILDYLLTLGNIAEGKFNLRSHKNLNGVVRWINVSRGNFTGPEFDIEAVTSFGEPAKKRIKKKFEKKYETEHKIDLLAYYELQPEIPENNWLPSVREFVKNNIKSSRFQRVWIYSTTQNRIIFVYPAL